MNQARQFGPGATNPVDVPQPGNGHQPRTALPVIHGTPRHFAAHLQRLQAGAAALDRPVDWLMSLQDDVEQWLCSAAGDCDVALRMVLHPAEGMLSARLELLPVAAQPYRLAWRPHPLQACQDSPLAMHKGLSGPWSAEVLAEAHQKGTEDALLFWADGSLAETALAAVGVEFEGRLLLPDLPGRVASLAERLDLPDWAAAQGLAIERRVLFLEHARAGRLWCMNALRGIWPAILLCDPS